MRPRFSWIHDSTKRAAATMFVCVVLLLIATPISQAQSGRRPPKQPTAPDPLPPKSEAPPIKPSAKDNSKPRVPVMIAYYLEDVASSDILARLVQKGCLERLTQSAEISATAASRDINRKLAIDAAKASSDAYVVWFSLDLDVAGKQRQLPGGTPDIQYLYVKYEVFTPVTGKTKTAGHVYQRPAGTVGSPLPSPSGTTYAGDYLLKHAGRELADRIFDTLGVARPRAGR